MKIFSKVWLIITVIILLIILSVILFYFNQVNKRYSISDARSFEITEGQSRNEIISNLSEMHVIDAIWSAMLYVKLEKSKFLPGIYTIPKNYNLHELFSIFGNEAKKEVKLTIPEGWNRQQIAEKIMDYGLNKDIFLTLTTKDEGKLFPDTYYISEKTTEDDLANKMKANYSQKTSGVNVTEEKLILASIVEREAKNDNERSVIAGIYQNRLLVGMALEADPTVQYAKYTDLNLAPLDGGKHNYWAPITVNDYRNTKSPYNTYLSSGLPLGPICNPGIKSILAAITPAKTDAVYFFHTKTGEIITSRTLQEHNVNKVKYL